MNVSELLLRLKDAKSDAIILLLPSYADFTEAEELGDVVLIAEPWTCERHHKIDGTTTYVHYPSNHRPTLGWDAATDECWTEQVVILSPQSRSVEARLHADVGALSDSESLADDLHTQALEARRQMIADGRLLPADEFRARLGISKKRFGRMLADGQIFGLDVDGMHYFPSLLADRRLNGKRLQELCRIIAPAPAGSRLNFLSTPHGALGDKSLLEMLDDDGDYKRLCEMAKAWAAQYSRTSVTLYEGEHETEPSGLAPLFTAITEVDPRKPLWIRASKALHEHGYQWPLGPYPEYRTHTMFVARQSAGCRQPVPEACVQILAKDDFIRVRVLYESGKARASGTMSVAKGNSVVDVAKKVVARLRRR